MTPVCKPGAAIGATERTGPARRSVLRRLSCTRRAARDQRGAATVEFVIIFPVLLMIFIAMFESGWLMTKYMMLDRGVSMAVREIRLGLMANPDADKLRTSICDFAAIITDCEQTLLLELRTLDDPGLDAAFPHSQPICTDTVDPSLSPTDQFSAGGAQSIMIVRACVLIQPVVPGLVNGFSLGWWLPKDASGRFHQMVSFGAFMNEPG